MRRAMLRRPAGSSSGTVTRHRPPSSRWTAPAGQAFAANSAPTVALVPAHAAQQQGLAGGGDSQILRRVFSATMRPLLMMTTSVAHLAYSGSGCAKKGMMV